ncbi:MAG: outer membrane beta-barrel domain-containing protein [Deltaproteobacteria bacterium]|nr:outer membrane beta-barrel domain-containing protein [Deltaproteobacteria bacterium]
MMLPRLMCAGLVLGCSLASPLARAARDDAAAAEDDDNEGEKRQSDAATSFQRIEERKPRAGTPLIDQKLFPMGGRFELTGIFDYSFNDKYVDHLGGSGAAAFHLFDWLAFEGFGGYLLGGETGIIGNVRADGSSAKRANEGQECFDDANGGNGACEPQLPDMWMTTWFAGGDIQWSPIYGKISAVSELDLNFQLYALAGAGAEGITRYLNTGGFDGSQVRFSGNYGLGVRLIPWKWVALRAELRNYNGLNPNVEEHNANDEDACTSGYTLVVGADKQCFPDISTNTMFQVGLSLLL